MAAAGCTGDDRELRMRMVQEQIIDRGVTNRAVVAAMQKVPRHEFVPARWRPLAYSDRPLPIGKGQTISQPYIVAYMTAALARPMAPRPNWMTRVMPGVVPAVGQGFNEKAADLAATSQYSFRQEWRTDAGDNFGAIPRSTRPIAKSHFRNGRAGWSSPPQNCPENCGGAVSHRALPTAHYRKGIMATGLCGLSCRDSRRGGRPGPDLRGSLARRAKRHPFPPRNFWPRRLGVRKPGPRRLCRRSDGVNGHAQVSR